MIPTYIAMQLAAQHQRELESQVARRRLARQLATTSCRSRRIDTVFPALRRMAAGVAPQRRPYAARTAAGPASCCAA